LPTCSGAAGENPLKSNVNNSVISEYKESPVGASSATCKPAGAAAPAAVASLVAKSAAQ